MKNKKNIIITVSIIVLIIGILLLNILDNPNDEKKEQKPKIAVNVLYDKSPIDALFAFSGTYIKNQYIISMNVVSNENISMTVTDGERFATLTLELDKNNILVNQEELMEIEKLNLKIVKTETGIKVTSTSEVEDSIFNDLSDTYETVPLEDKKWSGYYTNEEKSSSIIIDEYSEGIIYIAIDSIYYTNYVEKYDTEKIILEEANTKDDEEITIEKTENGVKIISNKKGDKYLFNKVIGEYVKEN